MARRHVVCYLATVLAASALAGGASAEDAGGFLYGRAETTSGEVHIGFLRWGDQEISWDDLFQSGKTELPYADNPAVPSAGSKRKRVSFMGITMHVGHDDAAGSRIVAVRFGDLAAILPHGEGSATLQLKSGASLEVEGYADDVASDVVVFEGTGETRLPWEDLAAIRFQPVPPGAARGATRLYGDVKTDAGTFTGFITWDKSLGLSTDLLEGEDGGKRVELAMGDIVAIDRVGQLRCEVQLRDGRGLTLRGTSHVSRGNRGLLVEDARFGKVEVPWDAFDEIALRDPVGSGAAYDAYPSRGMLSGTLRTTDGTLRDGRLVLDLDEAEAWEMLNGSDHDVAYDIPLHRVAAISRRGDDGSVVTLVDGQTLDLDSGQDVSGRNAGVLILGPGESGASYVPWSEVTEIRFASGH